MLKLKLQYFDYLMRRTKSLEKAGMLGKIESRRRGRQRMRCLDGHHQLKGNEFEQAPRDSEGQGSLVHCSVGELPTSGAELLTPALAGGFSTTEKPGKPKFQCDCLSPRYVYTHTRIMAHAHTLQNISTY